MGLCGTICIGLNGKEIGTGMTFVFLAIFSLVQVYKGDILNLSKQIDYIRDWRNDENGL